MEGGKNDTGAQMAGMKRFVTYIYSYEERKKGSNTGFARIEIRGDDCRVEIHLRGIYTGQSVCKVCLFQVENGDIVGFPIGEMQIANGTGEFGAVMKAGRIAESPSGIFQMEGLVLISGDGRMFLSRWKEGAPIEVCAEHFREWKPEAERGGQMQEAGAEKSREESLQEPSQPSAGPLPAGRPRQTVRMKRGGNIRSGVQSAGGAMSGQGERPGNAGTPKAGSASGVRPQQSGRQDGTGNTGSADRGISGVQPRNMKEERAEQTDGPESLTQRQTKEIAGRTQGDIGSTVLTEPSVRRPSGNGLKGMQPVRGRSGSAEPGENPKGGASEGALSGENPAGPAPGNTMPEEKPVRQPSDSTVSGEKPVRRQSTVSGEKPVRQQPDKASPEEKPVRRSSDGPVPGENQESQPAGGALCRAQPSASSVECEQTVSKSGTAREEEILSAIEGRHPVPETVTATEIPMRNVFPVCDWPQVWERLVKEHPVFAPFEDREAVCVQIELKDLRELPKRYWYLGNNSFLLHGFFNYCYLVVGRTSEQRWFLGVPGIYQRQERVMAAIFGFPEFLPAAVQGGRPGQPHLQEGGKEAGDDPVNQFGCWYRFIEE